jgi:hypothetical protein
VAKKKKDDVLGLHPRHFIYHDASVDLSGAIIQWLNRHPKLSWPEIVSLLLGMVDAEIRGMLKHEREKTLKMVRARDE